MTIQETIRQISFFDNLNDEEIEIIASISVVSKYNGKSILYYESEVNKNLLFLVDGLIKIYKIDKFGLKNNSIKGMIPKATTAGM